MLVSFILIRLCPKTENIFVRLCAILLLVMMWMPFIWMIIFILIPTRARIFLIMSVFAQYGRGYSNKADWRRDNVNVLIKEIHETVRECKPWVKFGVSPFGIYRNKKNDPNGSDTRGLQNYDDLYADVLMWINNGG